jgi:hypothetical protein
MSNQKNEPAISSVIPGSERQDVTRKTRISTSTFNLMNPALGRSQRP